MSKAVTVGASALLGCILCATPLSLRLLPEGKVSLSVPQRRLLLVLIAKHIGAPTGATTTTIQDTSGSATTDSGGTTDSLISRGGHASGSWPGSAPATHERATLSRIPDAPVV